MRTLPVFAGLATVTALAAFAQSREAGPRFEITDVHRSAGAANPFTYASGGFIRGSRYDFRKATMIDLIRAAYGIDPEMIVGGPNWLGFDRFDVAAKTDPGTSPAAMRLMLQDLLAGRFGLVLHKDTRPMPAFALKAGKVKPTLLQSAGTGEPDCTYQSQPGDPIVTASCRNMTMDAFALRIRAIANDYLSSPVVNETGIDGDYDFELKWNQRSRVLPAGAERMTIFSAVQKQLGLVLAPSTAPEPVIVIDRANENPGPNAPDVARRLPPRITEFEVADLKINKSNDPDYIRTTLGGGVEAGNVALQVLLGAGWDMDWAHTDKGIANIPRWASTMHIDIHAKAPAYANAPPPPGTGYIDDDARLMIRNLLIDRLQMKTHMERRPRDAYTLVAVRPKMKKADPSHRANCANSKTIPNDPRDANPLLSRLISCQNVTMAQFAGALHGFAVDDLFDDVEDATSLTGRYDFILSFTPAFLLDTAAASAGPDPTGGIALSSAIARQLGLKLELRKRPLPTVVIDHMEEKPLAN
jgi:uncharacterized protein (TIGR03435 family)